MTARMLALPAAMTGIALAMGGAAMAQPYGYGRTCAENPRNCAYQPYGQSPQLGAIPSGGSREIQRLNGPPVFGPNVPLVNTQIDGLRAIYEHWMLTIVIRNQAPDLISPMVTCVFTNGGRPVAQITHTSYALAPGQSAVVELDGPPVTASYVDGGTCHVVGPLM